MTVLVDGVIAGLGLLVKLMFQSGFLEGPVFIGTGEKPLRRARD
jgi:hypothetical protein